MNSNRGLVRAVAMSTGAVAIFALFIVARGAQSGSLSTAALSRIRIKNFGCINENFFRGAQPRERDFAELAAAGIKTVIDLQQDGEAHEQQLVEAAGMKFYRIGLSDSVWPSPEKTAQFLKLVNDPANQPVFVHCHGGKHRAGAMTAIYRITHDGWNADRAYEEMKQYNFESGFGHSALKDFVYDYHGRMDKKGVVVSTK